MGVINRQPGAASENNYDLIIVGGGIYGACATYEAAKRGKRVLLIERDDFGGATSLNSLRILHGGLRYLQSLDFKRFGESVEQRRWFTQRMPQYVQPLKCLMPLYGDGLRKPGIFRIALAMNDTLSRKRNRGVPQDKHLASGKVINKAQTAELFEKVDQDGLRGGAVWHDAFMLNPQRMLIELLRAACELGATALNYVRCENLIVEEGRTAGVEAIDCESGEQLTFKSDTVLNCAGPWCRSLASKFHRDMEPLYRPSLAFNLLINKPSLSEAAVAVTPKQPGARTYFVVPFRDRIFAGTFHAPWTESLERPRPTVEQITRFIADLNAAVPGLDAGADDVLRIFPGFMPTLPDSDREPAHRPAFIDHGREGGPAGAFTISGIKWTTAQREARLALDRILGKTAAPPRANSTDVLGAQAFAIDLNEPPSEAQLAEPSIAAHVRQLFHEESALHLDDFLIRRTDWAAMPADAFALAPRVAEILECDRDRRETESNRLKTALAI